MSEDLISGNFVEDIDRNILKKVLGLSRFILNLVILYSILELVNWYLAVSNSLGIEFKHNSTYYALRIQPFVAVILLTLSIINSTFFVKANKLIDLSVTNADADLFNKGYNLYYTCGKISLVAFCISLASVSIRILLK